MKLLHTINLSKALYIGPRGGKWSDPQHTIPWKFEEKKRDKKEDLEKLKIVTEILKGTASDVYVHGSDSKVTDRHTGYVTLFVEANDVDSIKHYGKVLNFIKPRNPVYIEDIKDSVVSSLKKDYKAGKLPLELAETIEFAIESADDDEDLAFETLAEEMNPPDIVDSAQLWDSPDFVDWFVEKFPQYTFVQTQDGAVSPEIDSLKDPVISMSHSEFDKLVDVVEAHKLKKALYIGPRGGKWADPQHTIPFDYKKHGGGKKIFVIDMTKPKKEEVVSKPGLVVSETPKVTPLGNEGAEGTKTIQPKDKPVEKQSERVAKKPKLTVQKEKKLAVEVGEHVWGSRADQWEVRNRNDLGSLTPEEQAKFCTKKKLMPVKTTEELLAMGCDAGCIVMRNAVENSIAAKAYNSLEGRQLYMDGIDYVSRSLDACTTSQDIEDFIEDWYQLNHGRKRVLTLSEDEYGQVVDDYRESIGSPVRLPWKKRKSWEKKIQDVQSKKWDHSWGTDEWKKWDAQEDDLINQYQAAGGRETTSVLEVLAWKVGKGKYDVSVSIDHDKKGYTVFVKDPSIAKSIKENPYARMAASLGTRIIKLTGTQYSEKLPKQFRDARSKVQQWESSDVSEEDRIKSIGAEKAEKKVRGKKRAPFRWERTVYSEINRSGGEPVESVNPKDLAQEFGFKNVQFGHWVTEGDADSHIHGAHGALRDLSDILGVDRKVLSLNGRLSLGIGARGSGKASAHYEPSNQIINLTKTAGGGSLCHEWAHAVDNILTKAYNPESTKSHTFVSDGDTDKIPSKVVDAFSQVMSAIEYGSADVWEAKRDMADLRQKEKERRGGLTWHERALYRDLFKKTRKVRSTFYKHAAALSGANGYWARPHEMFARAFESYVEDTLTKQKRKSSYLVSGTQEAYPTFKFASKEDAAAGRHAQVYPQGEDRKHINQAMQKLIDVLRDTKTLEKALKHCITIGKRCSQSYIIQGVNQ